MIEQSIHINDLIIEHQYLDFTLMGLLKNCEQRDKLRVLLLFEHEYENRRIPIDVDYEFTDKNQTCKFTAHAHIHLPSVFFQKKEFEDCKMSLLLFYGYEERYRVPFDVEKDSLPEKVKVEDYETSALVLEGMKYEVSALVLEGELFQQKNKIKKGFLHSVCKAVLFAGCVLLFPFFLLAGMTKYKNPKAILKYVSATTSRISGISYSKREWKTNYFARCYQRRIGSELIPNRVVFLSERRLDLNGNLHRVMEGLKSHDGLEIILLQKEKTVSNLSFHELKQIAETIAQARMIILDDFYPQLHALEIREDTKVIQLWHACGAFKTFGFTRMDKPGWAPQQSKNHRCYNYTFVSGERIRSIYSEAFGLPIEHVLTLGVPRTDVFFSEEYRQSIRQSLYQKYPTLQHKKVVLIAPTFRGDGNRDAYYPVERLSLDYLCRQLPEEYVFVTKMHPFVKNRFEYEDRNSHRILDLSVGENINDLLFITDILVTDYSSVVFEAALMNIPMVFYSYDMEEYMRNRDVYYDYEHFVPGPIVRNQEELSEKLLEAEGDSEKMHRFKDIFLDALEGDSTEKISNFIYHLI